MFIDYGFYINKNYYHIDANGLAIEMKDHPFLCFYFNRIFVHIFLFKSKGIISC